MSEIHGLTPVVDKSLVLWLDAGNPQSFDGNSTTWRDLSNNTTGGTLFNNILYDSTNKGSLTFNGTNNYIKTNNVGFITNSINQHTYCAFVKISTSGMIISYGEYPDSNYSSGIGYSGGKLSWNTNGGTDKNISNLNCPTNQWVFVGCSVTSLNTTLYVNSLSEIITKRYQGGVISINPFFIGAAAINGVIGTYFNGNISNVQIYNRALSQDEITQNFNANRNRYGI